MVKIKSMSLKILILSIGLIVVTCSEPIVGEGYGTVSINFSLPEEGNALLEIENRFDIIVASYDYGIVNPGSYSYEWSGRDAEGQLLPEGLYYAVLTVQLENDTKIFSSPIWLIDPNQ